MSAHRAATVWPFLFAAAAAAGVALLVAVVVALVGPGDTPPAPPAPAVHATPAAAPPPAVTDWSAPRMTVYDDDHDQGTQRCREWLSFYAPGRAHCEVAPISAAPNTDRAQAGARNWRNDHAQ